MQPELFNYQAEGARWLSSKRYALLADEMGLGKSAQAITAADTAGSAKSLVLCPAVARLNWTREWQKFSSRKLNCTAILSAADITQLPESDVIVCSYDLLANSAVMSALSRRRWNLAVLDESHYLKNRKAARTRAALHLAIECSDRAWALSGTPAPNDPSELWTLLRAFGVYTSDYWSFMRRYVSYRETPWGIQITGGLRIPELRELLAPITLRRKKADVLRDLPPILFSDVVVEPAPVDRATWEYNFPNYVTNWSPDKRWGAFNADIAKEHALLEHLASDMGLAGEASIKILEGLQQKVKSLRRWVGLQKVQRVIDMVSAELDADAYDKIVLFGVHKDVVHGLHEGLKKYGAALIYGGTPPKKRDSFVQWFQTDKLLGKERKCRVMIANIEAGGIAINLTAAHHIVFVEADWVPAKNQQAAGRCHRIGQTKPVTCRFIGLAGSLDEKIQRVLRQKTKVLTELFDAETVALSATT